jgi:hypothetical protein
LTFNSVKSLICLIGDKKRFFISKLELYVLYRPLVIKYLYLIKKNKHGSRI